MLMRTIHINKSMLNKQILLFPVLFLFPIAEIDEKIISYDGFRVSLDILNISDCYLVVIRESNKDDTGNLIPKIYSLFS